MSGQRDVNPAIQGRQTIPEPGQWRIHVSNEWDVLGPFPIHAREQYFFSPAFPLQVSPFYTHEPQKSWPSSLTDDGRVSWSKSQADRHGNLTVSFPDVNWERIRSTEGWAALQYHSVLRTTLTVCPPGEGDYDCECECETDERVDSVPFNLLAELKHGSHFAIVPSTKDLHDYIEDPRSPFVASWHPGNIYDLSRAPPNSVSLPCMPYRSKPTTYEILIGGDYEIRLFGDPLDSGDKFPTLRLRFTLELESKVDSVVRQESHDIICDFVNGFCFGSSIAVGLRSVEGWWIVQDVITSKDFPAELSLSLHHQISTHHSKRLALLGAQRLAPSQSRVVPLVLKQKHQCFAKALTFSIELVESQPNKDVEDCARTIRVEVTLHIQQLPSWTSGVNELSSIRASFLFANSNPTLFLVKPPRQISAGCSTAPILALHGAGVDVVSSPFWSNALPQQKHSWVIMPVGRTEWGLDWHGVSAAEAWATIAALASILNNHDVFRPWTFEANSKVILMGHSNGGQGVWYLASRYPDRVLAAIPAAGYIKSQAYVPLAQSRSAHFVDPSLRSILESSLTADDNDLFMSNVIDIPVLAIHGGADTNVPTWHSREYLAVLEAWGPHENKSLHIDAGKPHWYPEVFASKHVRDFLNKVLETRVSKTELTSSFTLTVADPAHSGSLRGWSVNSLKVPGRIGRIEIKVEGKTVYIRTSNVRKITVGKGGYGADLDICVDDMYLSDYLQPHNGLQSRSFEFHEADSEWKLEAEVEEYEYDEYMKQRGPKSFLHGRAQDILESPDAHVIVTSGAFLSSALRVAHMLDVYHKLDAHIFTHDEAMTLFLADSFKLPPGNIITVGCFENSFAREMIDHHYTPFKLSGGFSYSLARGKRTFKHAGLGLVLSYPHLVNPAGRSLIIMGQDREGLEKALRLFPYRTGVTVPDWLLIGKEADERGTAGVLGAGVFDDFWQHNAPMTWLP